MIMANTREIILFTDCMMANSNGDMINDNRPRQDERTGKLEMSDVRIKRYYRDEADNRGFKIFVKPRVNEKGAVLDCKGTAKKIIADEKVKKEDLRSKLIEDYNDVKLFGAVVTDPTFHITGPLQIMWSKSIHEAEVKFAQGTSVFASNQGKKQGTTWSKYYTPYALFKTYMVYNDMTAKRQDISITEEEIEEFKDILISGIKNYKSTSKNQMPRLLIEVVYSKNYIDGELDYITVNKEKEDLSIRNIDEFIFDLAPLAKYYIAKKDIIEKVNIYRHPKVKLQNVIEDFCMKDI